MDEKKVKKLNNALAITSFVYAGLCFVTIILLWALGFNIYKVVNGANEEFDMYDSIIIGLILSVSFLVTSAGLLLDGVPQILFGITCIKSIYLETTHKRAGKLMLLSLLDILGVGRILISSELIVGGKFTVFTLMAIMLAALFVLKLVISIYILAKKKSLYGIVDAPDQSA